MGGSKTQRDGSEPLATNMDGSRRTGGARPGDLGSALSLIVVRGVGEGKGRGRRAIRCQLQALVSHHPVRGAWGCQGTRHLDWTKLAHTPLRAEPPLDRRWGSIAASEAIPIRVQTHLHIGSLTNASTANCVRC